VVPFVASGGRQHGRLHRACQGLRLARGDRFGIPVYLYGEAATSPARQRLADVRRGQYEGLRTQIGESGREPDFGPAKVHATAGAMAVGARPFLIAYNINLESRDLELAKRIARRIRESSGGLPRVQANGFWIAELDRAQVSMNLLDYKTTPLWLVWEAVRSEAAEDGVHLAESELIGLAPLGSLVDVADHAGVSAHLSQEERLAGAAGFLKLRDFSPLQALELRLEAARGTEPMPGPTDGLLIERAAAVATTGGWIAAGSIAGETAVLSGRASGRGVLARACARRGSGRRRPPPDRGRRPLPGFVRPRGCSRRPGDARADRRPHASRVRRHPRGGVADAGPRGRLSRDPRGRRWILSTVAATRAASDADLLAGARAASPRCSPTAPPRPRPSPATGWTWRRSCANST